MFTADGVEVLDRPLHTHGGARAGAGRKSKDYEPTPEKIDYEAARARHEAAKADKAELDYKIQSGEYGPRAAWRQAAATAVAQFAQTARSIPDNLERRHGIAPEVAEQIALDIDKALQSLAEALRMVSGD